MGEQAKRPSILDGLKAGEIVVSGREGRDSESGDLAIIEPGTGSDSDASARADASETGFGEDDFGASANPEPRPARAEAGTDDNGPAEASEERRGRGRPPGSPNRKKANVGLIESLLISVHTMAAAALKMPHLALGEEEAENLAKALAKVQEQYDVSLDPKTEAWINLAMVGGAVYGPRVLVAMHLAASNKPQKQTTPKPVAEPVMNGHAPGSGFTPQSVSPMPVGKGPQVPSQLLGRFGLAGGNDGGGYDPVN